MDTLEPQTIAPQSLAAASPAPVISTEVSGDHVAESNNAGLLSVPTNAQPSSPAASTSAQNDPQPADGSVTNDSEASKARQRKKKAKAAAVPIHLPGPLAALPNTTTLPDLEDFNLMPEQMKNPLFVAISRILIVYGNAWQSANDLVDGIRHFNLANLGGRTPKGTVQGAISTGLALASALGTFEPIEKQRMNGTTYYRMAAQAMEPPSSGSDAEKAKARIKAKPVPTNARRKPKQQSSGDGAKSKKRRPVTAWNSDTMSSDSSDDDDNDSPKSSSSSKRVRTGTPSKPLRQEPVVPNGLRKLPKGYVYDTEIHQSSLMNLSINPTQTGEYMEHLRGINAMENDYPDRRGDFSVDLNEEPSMFAVEQQTGYTYPRLRTSSRERLQKADCEDGFAVSDLRHDGGFLGRLFCITDGHGGQGCSAFVIATVPTVMQVILGKYRPADLSLPHIQELVKTQITDAIRLIDKEYLDYKKQQYLQYKAKKLQHDPGSDGTTLIVNIFIDKWIICINVGDSRSILSSRDQSGRWNVNFHSEDHTPSLERLAQTIYANGGEFVTHDDKLIKFDPTLKNDKKHRQSLKEARIRVKDAASNVYGIPYRTRNGQCASVNLGACIGDVLYKLDPVNPVLNCTPDITFIDISNIQHGYLLMASDGLWDYVLRGGKVQDQNAAVSQYVGDKLDRGWNHQRIVCTLSDREGEAGLYSDSIQEYDDFTAILVTVGNKHLQEHGEEELLRQKESARLRDAMMARKEKMKREEEEGKRLTPERQESEPQPEPELAPVSDSSMEIVKKDEVALKSTNGETLLDSSRAMDVDSEQTTPLEDPMESPLHLESTAEDTVL
ncbi:hypothetical protein EMPS_08990 [Entomortierella parvispora]|uniref:PPM-type phosphatase domain-containing protein n=1 Tax=Entomortierella parvispora TaxID=205924 RepID=A0A9P3LZL9_9FUNG|nr:hypothetical protein EMPS_08990 [Entomortierella parvispora]